MLNDILRRCRHFLAKRGPADGFWFLLRSLAQLVRGLGRGYWLVFIGRNVVIRARRRVSIGRYTRIEDYCELDGFGAGGLTIGTGCKIGKFSIVRVPPVPHTAGERIVIGDQTTFAEFCFVGGAASVRIGKRNAIGAYVSIHPQNHLPHSAAEPARTSEQGIQIGDDNWFGAKATILDGVHIGSRVIVAAGAVVRENVDSDVMVAGVPATPKRRLQAAAERGASKA